MTARDLKRPNPYAWDPLEHNRHVARRRDLRRLARSLRAAGQTARRMTRTFRDLGAAAERAAEQMRRFGEIR